MLITVKAAPTPSNAYGETVCVAGIRQGLGQESWVRLYPINFRAQDAVDQFRKYEVVRLRAKPARNDRRLESWRPDLGSIRRERVIPPGKQRRSHIDHHIQHSMCELLAEVRSAPPGRSLAVIRPAEVSSLRVRPNSGWKPEQQRAIDRAAAAEDLFGVSGTPLIAPRFTAKYVYRCTHRSCRGHEQGMLDWELVALQHRLRNLTDAEVISAIEQKFFAEKVRPGQDTAFYVGNQAKWEQTFSVLGVYTAAR
ncbi:hypothetical protein [Actinokineospora enzanensis]|uniref:hypothetical protein n=1 Tax=Actinokineospora enzanensis TaxID=155975 RepID=UPI0003A32E7E|nr:hypothetical protein [Actinokineospora enzanensis]